MFKCQALSSSISYESSRVESRYESSGHLEAFSHPSFTDERGCSQEEEKWDQKVKEKFDKDKSQNWSTLDPQHRFFWSRLKTLMNRAAAEAVSPSHSPSRLANTCQHRSITSNYTSIGDDPTEVTTDQANLEDLHLQHSLISFDDEDCTSSASSSSDDVITSDYSEVVPNPNSHTFSPRYHPRPLKFSGQEKEEEENIPNRFTSLHCILLLKLYLIMSLLLFAIILLLTFAVKDSTGEPPNFSDSSVDNSTSSTAPSTFQISLDPENKFRVFWSVDQADESVVFELRIAQQQLNWFAFGFSAYGSIAEADLCLLWFDKRGKLWFDVSKEILKLVFIFTFPFQDIKTDNESFVLSDLQSNDCRLIKVKRDRREHSILRVAFRRSWDTCDPEDYVIDVISF